MSGLDSMARRGAAGGEPAARAEARGDALRVLLVGCANRDEAAFERLYRLTAPKLYALCVGLLRRRELAEEVLQEIYAQIWREAPRFEVYRAAPMTWMTVLARNRAIDVLRRSADVARSTGDAPESADAATDPMDHVERLRESDALRRCLERLETRQREAVLLAFFQGLTHGQLSETLGQPMGTVKSWVRRGLGRLRRCLEQ